MTRVRQAGPSDAAEILELVRSDFARLDPTLRNKSATPADIEAFSRRLENPGATRRLVVLGDGGIKAYMKTGPWTLRDKLTFSDVPPFLHELLVRGMGRSGLFRSTATGLFTLSTPDRKLADNDAVERLVEESRLLSSANTVLIPALDADTKLHPFSYK